MIPQFWMYAYFLFFTNINNTSTKINTPKFPHIESNKDSKRVSVSLLCHWDGGDFKKCHILLFVSGSV